MDAREWASARGGQDSQEDLQQEPEAERSFFFFFMDRQESHVAAGPSVRLGL
jgi:hypothetical protein